MNILERIKKINYIQKELELVPTLEEIIFKINIQPNGKLTNGAKFEDINSELEKMKLFYTDQFLLNLLQKMKDDYVLFEIDEKWYSVMM